MQSWFSNPKSKAATATLYTARDQYAKYVLTKKRAAYDIYVDEGKLIKAFYTAFPKKVYTFYFTFAIFMPNSIRLGFVYVYFVILRENSIVIDKYFQ